MKKIIKTQIIKLFYNAEYLGYNLIGALLVILYGWGYSAVILENEMSKFQGTLLYMIKYTFPAILILTICLYNYTYVKEFQNKTIYYEKMHGIKLSHMLLGRFIIPLLNSCFFCFLLLVVQNISGIMYQYCDHDFEIMLLEKVFFSFVIVLHLNIVIGIYFFILPHILAGSALSFIVQWFLPTTLVPHLSIGTFDNKILINLFCCNQFISIWGENNIDSFCIKQIILSFFGECIMLFIIACCYYKRKGWN